MAAEAASSSVSATVTPVRRRAYVSSVSDGSGTTCGSQPTVAWRGARLIVPDSIGSLPTMVRISVDLPDPFGPTTAVTSPSASVRSRPEKRVRAPKATSRPEMVRVDDMGGPWMVGRAPGATSDAGRRVSARAGTRHQEIHTGETICAERGRRPPQFRPLRSRSEVEVLGRSLADPAVDCLTQDVGVAGVPGVLLDEVDEHRAHG